MPTINYDYVDSFNMSTALFDDYGCFYNAYRRLVQVEPGVRSAHSRDGTLKHSESSRYGAYPIVHFASGDLALLRGIIEPENRGRYTVGGYDFSIISTSNDPYGKRAIKFMSYMPPNELQLKCEPVVRPKLNAASFNTMTNNITKSQDLLIDHVHNRVYRLGYEHDKPVTTQEGATPDLESMCLPNKLGRSTLAYATASTNGFKVQKPIRLTQPRTRVLPEGYNDVVTVCAAWFAHQGKPFAQIIKEEFEGRSTGKYNHNINAATVAVIDPNRVVNQGFANLTPYERACVAKNNTTKPLPRLAQFYYHLCFDSEAFFNSFNETK